LSNLDAFSLTSGLGQKSSWVNGQTLTGEFNWKAGSELDD
jgi:hypothetical protein